MCLIALSVVKSKDWNGKDSYFFKVVANRDEYHERQTTQMHWWSNKPILAGKDELAGALGWGLIKKGSLLQLLTSRRVMTANISHHVDRW